MSEQSQASDKRLEGRPQQVRDQSEDLTHDRNFILKPFHVIFGFMLTSLLWALSFPAFGTGIFAHVALVPWCLVVLGTRGGLKHYFLQYFLGTIFWLYMLNWLIQVTFGGWIGISLYMAIYWPLAAWLLRLAHRRLNVASIGQTSMVWLLPLVWGGLEWFRSRYIAGGFGWFQMGHSQGGYKPLDQIQLPILNHWARCLAQSADLMGETTITITLLMVNGLLIDAFWGWWHRASENGKTWFPRQKTIVVFSIYGSLMIYGVYRLQETEPLQPGPKVIAIQTDVRYSVTEMPTAEKTYQNFQALMAQIERIDSDVELIILPEGALPFPLNKQGIAYLKHHRDGRLTWLNSLVDLCRVKKISVLAGANSFHFKDGELEQYPRIQNSAFLLDSNGEISRHYSKMHLVPFGEYLPWVENVPALKQFVIELVSPWGEDYTIMPGDKPERFEISGFTFAAPICYEDTVAGQCRQLVSSKGSYQLATEKKADFLANLTNSSWYGGVSQRIQHVQMASLRAIENRTPMVRSVNTGVSSVINSRGDVTAIAGKNVFDAQSGVGIASDELTIDQRLTLYCRLGNWPVILLIALGISGVLCLPRLNRHETENF